MIDVIIDAFVENTTIFMIMVFGICATIKSIIKSDYILALLYGICTFMLGYAIFS